MITATTRAVVPAEPESTTPIEVQVDWTWTEIKPAFIAGPPEKCYPSEGGELVRCVVTRLEDGVEIEDGEDWLLARCALGQLAMIEEAALLEALDLTYN